MGRSTRRLSGPRSDRPEAFQPVGSLGPEASGPFGCTGPKAGHPRTRLPEGGLARSTGPPEGVPVSGADSPEALRPVGPCGPKAFRSFGCARPEAGHPRTSPSEDGPARSTIAPEGGQVTGSCRPKAIRPSGSAGPKVARSSGSTRPKVGRPTEQLARGPVLHRTVGPEGLPAGPAPGPRTPCRGEENWMVSASAQSQSLQKFQFLVEKRLKIMGITRKYPRPQWDGPGNGLRPGRAVRPHEHDSGAGWPAAPGASSTRGRQRHSRPLAGHPDPTR